MNTTPTTSSNTALKYLTTCKFCYQQFSASGVPIIGEDAPDEAKRMIGGLVKHLQIAHKKQVQAMFATASMFANQFSGYLILQQFETQDPNLQAAQERLRTFLHGISRRPPMTDQEIEGLLQGDTWKENGRRAATEAVCKEIRDRCCETGAYGSSQQETNGQPKKN